MIPATDDITDALETLWWLYSIGNLSGQSKYLERDKDTLDLIAAINTVD